MATEAHRNWLNYFEIDSNKICQIKSPSIMAKKP